MNLTIRNRSDRRSSTGMHHRLARLTMVTSLCCGCVTFGSAGGCSQPDSDSPTAASVINEAAKTLDFRPHFEAGRVSVYQFNATVNIEQAIEDLKILAKNNSDLRMRLEIQAVDAETGVATIKLTYDKIGLSGSNSLSGETYDFDSERDPSMNIDNRVALLLNRLLKTEMIATVAADGRVQSITGNEAVVAAMETNSMLAGRIGEFNEQGLTQVLEGFWRVGEDDVTRAEGKSWVESQDTPMTGVGTLTFSTTFDFKGSTDKQASVEVLVDVTLTRDEPEDEEGGALEGDDEASQSIEGEDDPENLVLNSEAKQKAEEKAFEESLPAAERAELTSDTQSGVLLWDIERGELISRDTFLNFVLEIEQFEIFSQQMQLSVSGYDVESTWKRVSIE